jgi:hypothetical protein
MQILRQFIQEEIARLALMEAAQSVDSASQQGLALYIGPGKYEAKLYMLYDPTKVVEAINDKDPQNAINNLDISCVFGILNVSPDPGPYGALEVGRSAATKGYGPLLYDIAMTNEDAIMSDRGSVSKGALAVWSYYKNKRSDVKAKLIDDKDNPKTETEADDGVVWKWDSEDDFINDPRNYVYVATKKTDISSLTKNHQKVIGKLNNAKGISPRKLFSELSEKFFLKKYRE